MPRLLLLSLLLLPAHLGGAPDPPLFAVSEPLRAVLNAPILEAYRDKDKQERLYLQGSWSQKRGEQTERLSVKIRTRGNYRREMCDRPPLQLNFRKKEVVGTLMAGQDKLKMVSPCERGDKYQQLVYLEYLVYQLFALYSDYHFRTRLVDVAYVDSGSGDRRWSSHNFLIEDVDHMAARYGLQELAVPHTMRVQMDLAQTALVEIFQFMIGNVDYSTLKSRPGEDCCHNTKLLVAGDADQGFIPVAYDFDSAGIINAPYATVPASVPIRRITTRYFLGWCKEEARYRDAVARINARREEALALFAESPLLSDTYRKRALKYLGDSYDYLNDEKSFARNILGKCRGEVIAG
ncbi:hypothetical protein DWB85_10945 [Seongchinamella sediminis]|uniref:Uncharacterized protein n=1 Tax=Seongchinamella sediminis TaxID=2283635 RepID=A0A3L7DXA8_9GAMM|nr:hypothetical protein [Seongchinamella sediminis]RLQ21796.1 hypothetical protein DWB85_10945 [Seongchinamella sediminis]